MKKVFCTVLSILVLLAGMGFVSLAGSQSPQENPMMEIYTDGEKLANPFGSYEADGVEQEVDGQRTSGHFTGLNGMVMFWYCELDDEFALDVRYSMKVTEGKAKLIFVDADETIHVIAEMTRQDVMEDEEVYTMSIKDGLNRMKLVGTEDADVEFDISISGGSFVAAK